MRIFVAGATGYVGSRLVPRLVAGGHEVVVLTRDADRVARRPWGEQVEVVVGDASDARAVTGGMFGVDVAVHLVHAMEASVPDFRAAERTTARTIAAAAELAGVGHIVYLGGLAPAGVEEDALSPHLASRVETGRILADAGPPTTELRASLVLGAGSASFELVRFVAQAPFPVVVHPSWARGQCQPIAIPDLLDILVAVIDDGPGARHRILEVGGPEIGTYHDLVDVARDLLGGVPSVSAPVPTVISPVLTGQLLATLTPIDPGTVAPLIASLVHDSIVTGADGHEVAIAPTSVVDAMAMGLARTGEYAAMAGDPDWVGATLDLGVVAQVLQRLPHLPGRLLPGLRRDQLLSTAVDAVVAMRPS